MGTLADLTGGFMEGSDWADRRRRNKKYDEYLEQRNVAGARGLAGDEAARAAEWQRLGGMPEDFEKYEYKPMEDAPLLRFGSWLKDKAFGMFGQGQGMNVHNAAEEATSTVPVGGREAHSFFADGGAVNMGGPMSMYGPQWRGVPEPEEEEFEGPGLLDRAFNDTIAVNREARSDMLRANARQMNAGDAREFGAASRDVAVTGVRGILGTGAALAKDVLVDNPITQSVLGFAGWEGDDGAGSETPDGAPASDTAAPAQTSPIPSDTKAAAEGSVAAPQKTDQQVAQTALEEGERAAVEQFDYAMLPSHVSPEDMPSMSTDDWVNYRREMVNALMLKGMSPAEAHQQVDDVTVDQQMRGMNRELQKAMNYMQVGDLRSAGFAIRQGFQYFPNGVDVKLAVQTGQDGTRHLVAFGTDEKTGEPTGKPMLITPETLAVMRENFSNPSAVRTWTKDGRQQQMDLRDLERSEKATRSTASYQRESAKTDRMNAQNRGIEAEAELARARGGAAGGDVKESDMRESAKAITDYVFRDPDLDMDVMPQVEEAAYLIRKQQPSQHQLGDVEIANLVIDAAKQGKLEELLAYLRQGG